MAAAGRQTEMNARIIYFDCAGTLLHPAEPIGDVYARTAQAFGLSCDPKETGLRFRAAWKRAPRPVYAAGPDEKVDLAWWRDIVRESLSATGTLPPGNQEAPGFESCFLTLFRHYARPDAWRIYPEVMPVLEALRGKVRLGILSNFDARLYPLLDGHGLSRFFEITVISSESAACKPDAAIFTRAAALAGLPPEACLLAGDDPVNDWQGAKAAGWRVFQLRRPENSLAGLLPWRS